MANVLVDESYLQGIANAIRTKSGSNNTYTPAQMATAIENIPQSGTVIPQGGTLLSGYISYETVSNGWFNQSQTVGNNISITGNNNGSWKIIRFPLQVDKKYLCKTFFTDSGYPVFFVCDNNGKIIYSFNDQGKFKILDTTGLDNSNGLYLYVAYGNISNSYEINKSFSTANTVFVREILYPTTATSLGDL